MPLAVGMFVRAEITGRSLEEVVSIPGSAWKPDRGVWRLEARRDGEKVVLRAGKEKLGSFELPPSPMGLAVDDSDLRFRDVTWD